MDPEFLIGTVIRGVLSGRRKSSRRALRYLTGGRRSMVGAGSLLTLAELIWGLFETVTETRQPTTGGTPAPGGGPGGVRTAPPPIPGSGAGPSPAPAAGPPPVPSPVGRGSGPAAETAPGGDQSSGAIPPGVSPGAVRIVRLAISAARADGTLTDQERAAILERARAAGIESLIEREIRQPRPIAEIVAGVTDPSMRRDLYVLAYTIVRADESVTGPERIYLAQLAAHLGVDRDTAARLEADTASEIDAQAEESEAADTSVPPEPATSPPQSTPTEPPVPPADGRQ